MWCATALRNNTAQGYRDAARGLMVFSVVHLGAFARGQYFIEAHKEGGVGYILSLVVGMPLLWWYGFHRTLVMPPTSSLSSSSLSGSGVALSSLGELPAPGGDRSIVADNVPAPANE
jgi:hypothetical protein